MNRTNSLFNSEKEPRLSTSAKAYFESRFPDTSRPIERFHVDDCSVIIGMPCVGKTVFEQSLPSNWLVLDTDPFIQLMYGSWSTLSSLKKAPGDWAQQLRVNIEDLVHNLVVTIFNLAQESDRWERVLVVTNLSAPSYWEGLPVCSVAVSPAVLQERYNLRERSKFRLAVGREAKPAISITKAKEKFRAFRRNRPDSFIIRESNCYLSDLFGIVPSGDLIKQSLEGVRAYDDLRCLVKIWKSELSRDTQLILPSWIFNNPYVK